MAEARVLIAGMHLLKVPLPEDEGDEEEDADNEECDDVCGPFASAACAGMTARRLTARLPPVWRGGPVAQDKHDEHQTGRNEEGSEVVHASSV